MKYYPIRLTIFLSILGGLILCSCWAYSFSSSALKGVNSIAIERIDNNTTEYGIEDVLIDGLIEQFESENILKVVPVGQADLLITATITDYEHEPYSYTETQTDEYACRMTLNMRIHYAKGEKVLWEDAALSDYGLYAPDDGETRDEGNKRAIDKIITEIMNRTVRDW